MKPLESVGGTRPPTHIWSPERPREAQREPATGGADAQPELRPVSFETQLTDQQLNRRTDARELRSGATDLARLSRAAGKMSGSLRELRSLASRSSEISVKDEWSRAEIQGRVQELMRYMRNVAADSRPEPPRFSIETSRGSIEFPPSDLSQTARQMEREIDLNSVSSARTSVAAAGRALQAIREMRAELSEFSRQQLAPARNAADVARANAEAAESTLMWDESALEDAHAAQEAADSVAAVLKEQLAETLRAHETLDGARIGALLTA
ncbi:MAG: hypothetical protein CME06_09765 [Gemmatimonadetes bacterium]|nr:hypothetical protein [Gemmatimonadota bacterium]